MNRWKLGTLTFAALFAGTVAVGALSTADADPEPQPHMRSALDALNAAEGHLQKATHDKGGHRAKAVSLTRQAIAEVKAGIKFDNKH
jgi:hypothetical protein